MTLLNATVWTESCCDDLAVAVCGDPIVYVRALADLEQVRSTMPELVMAANRGSLLGRIERLLTPGREARPIAPVGVTILTLMMVGVLMWAEPAQLRELKAFGFGG